MDWIRIIRLKDFAMSNQLPTFVETNRTNTLSPMSEQQPLYRFHCVICGTPFTPARAHATTCKMECRVIRAAITKKWVEQIPDSEKTPIDKDEVKDGYKKATGGRDIPAAALAPHKDKAPEQKSSTAGKLLGKKNSDGQEPTPAVVPEPSDTKPEKKNDKNKAK